MISQEAIEKFKEMGFDDDQIQQAEVFLIKTGKVIINIINAVVNVIKQLAEILLPTISKLVDLLYRYRKYPVGYKRLMKMDQLKYYESISAGKSNNWRKVHGLHLIRC